MDRSNKKKNDQLGMPVGTASNRLRKMIIFDYVQKCGHDKCFQCGEKIDNIDNFSIEHKVPYLDSEDPVKLFFDIDNIAFSHLSCNSRASRPGERFVKEHGTFISYNNGCRCDECLNRVKPRRSEQNREHYLKIKNNPERRI